MLRLQIPTPQPFQPTYLQDAEGVERRNMQIRPEYERVLRRRYFTEDQLDRIEYLARPNPCPPVIARMFDRISRQERADIVSRLHGAAISALALEYRYKVFRLSNERFLTYLAL